MVSWHGVPVIHMRTAWTRVRRVAGLGPEVTPHILRHTAATWAVQAGAPIGLVAAVLGTTEAVVQGTYGHHAPEAMREVVGIISRRNR